MARHALARDFDRDLPQEQRLFLYLPLQHSEVLADQHDCVDLIGRLDANPDKPVNRRTTRTIPVQIRRSDNVTEP